MIDMGAMGIMGGAMVGETMEIDRVGIVITSTDGAVIVITVLHGVAMTTVINREDPVEIEIDRGVKENTEMIISGEEEIIKIDRAVSANIMIENQKNTVTVKKTEATDVQVDLIEMLYIRLS
jgi:hypothetical protein